MLSSKSSSTVTAAAGVMAYGVVGMAGVGKTVALLGLASDREIHDRFPDGILFMALGQGATLQSVIGELKKIVVLTGGEQNWRSDWELYCCARCRGFRGALV